MLKNLYMDVRLRKLHVVIPEELFEQLSSRGLLRYVDGICTNLLSDYIQKLDKDQRALRP